MSTSGVKKSLRFYFALPRVNTVHKRGMFVSLFDWKKQESVKYSIEKVAVEEVPAFIDLVKAEYESSLTKNT